MNDDVVLSGPNASVCVPREAVVQQPLPNLLAQIGLSILAIQTGVDKETLEGYRQQLTEPIPNLPAIPGVPDYDFRVIRSGTIHDKYRGLHRITEQLTTTPKSSHVYDWDVLLSHGDSHAIIAITGPGAATADMELWDRVISSFRFK